MKRFLLDTGIAGLYMDRKRGVYQRARAELARGNRIGIAAPVLGELAYRAEAKQAYAALWSLAAAPAASVLFFEKHLQPTPDPDFKRIGQLVADLDSEHFAVRKKATQEMDRLDATAAPALRRALGATDSPELRHRLQAALANLESKPLSPAELRQVRAITALEQIGTPAARRLLETLATGTEAAPSTARPRALCGA